MGSSWELRQKQRHRFMKHQYMRMIDIMSAVLEQKDFSPPRTRSPRIYAGTSEYRWTRDTCWKIDEVDLLFDNNHPTIFVNCRMKYRYSDPHSGDERESAIFGIGVGRIDSPLSFRIFKWLLPARTHRYIKEILIRLDDYSTPAKCLSQMEMRLEEAQASPSPKVREDEQNWFEAHAPHFRSLMKQND